MTNPIEVEVRGPLTKEQYTAHTKYFDKHATFVEEKHRILIDYSLCKSHKDLVNRTEDIRLRVTNKVPEIIVKLGGWGSKDSRKELSVITPEGTFDTLVQIYATLGYKKGVLCIRNSRIYMYQDTEFAFVEVPNHSYYYEAERLVHDDSESDDASLAVQKICNDLKLPVFSDEEFFDYIKLLNKEANTMFDFDNYTDGHFKKTYNL